LTEARFYDGLLTVWIAAAPLVFVALLVRAAPYGRHAPVTARTVPARWGWFVMESPAVVGMVVWWWVGRHRGETLAALTLALFLVHYVDRAWIYPWRLAPSARPMPLGIVAGAFTFQVVNTYLIGRWQFELAPPAGSFPSVRVAAGLLLFAAGFTLNRWADGELERLRRGADGYVLPTRGPYRRISCPNYLGEIVLWIGFALVAGSLAAAAFALWTVANLTPRARSHHRWYRERFPEATAGRRALVPGLW